MFRSDGIRAGGNLGLLPLPVLNGERGRSSLRRDLASTSPECALALAKSWYDTTGPDPALFDLSFRYSSIRAPARSRAARYPNLFCEHSRGGGALFREHCRSLW